MTYTADQATQAQVDYIARLANDVAESISNRTATDRARWHDAGIGAEQVVAATLATIGHTEPREARAALGGDAYSLVKDEVRAHLIADRMRRAEHLATITADELTKAEASDLIDEMKKRGF